MRVSVLLFFFYLVETDSVGTLTEAASADVETVLADESVAVTADTAVYF